jgi:hypothetical protein
MLIAGVTGNILVCGTSSGRVTFSEVWSLEEIHYVDLHEHGAVKCLWFSEGKIISKSVSVLLFSTFCAFYRSTIPIRRMSGW